MKQRDLIDSLLRELQSQLKQDGFDRRGPLLMRRRGSRDEIVQPIAVKKSEGRWGLLYGARVRFQCLEELVNGEEALKSTSGTYGGLAHLIAGVGYFDWTISELRSLPVISAAMVENVRLVALPFFGTYSGPVDLLPVMRGGGKTLGLSPEDKVVYHSAILWHLGDRAEALAHLKGALSERQNELPKKRMQIERLLTRLSGDDEVSIGN